MVLGAGISGLSFALFNKVRSIIVEKENIEGGLCKSRHCSGYTFDIGIHTLFTNNNQVKSLYRQLDYNKDFIHKISDARVWFDNKYIRYPIQQNLGAVSPAFEKECKSGLIESRKNHKNIISFQDYLECTYGKFLALQFFEPYNLKKFGVPLEELEVGPAIRKLPTFKKKGGLYNKTFMYPRHGIGEVPSRIHYALYATKKSELKLRSEIWQIKSDMIRTKVVSTIPLDVMQKFLTVPLKSQCRLQTASARIVTIGLNKKPRITFDWAYYSQKDISFYRLAMLSNFNPQAAPKSKFLIQLELPKQTSFSKIMKDLENVKIFNPKNNSVDFHDSEYIENAYPLRLIGDSEKITDMVRELKNRGVYSLGRFGQWKHIDIDECISEGMTIADEINSL